MTMTRLKHLLTPPIFESETKTTAAALIYNLLLFLLLCSVVGSIVILFTSIDRAYTLPQGAGVISGLILLLLLVRRGRTRLVATVLVWCIGALITVGVLARNSPTNTGYAAFMVLILVAGLLVGRRAILVTMLYSLSVALLMGIATQLGLIVMIQPSDTPLTRALYYVLYYLIVGGVLYTTVSLMTDAFTRLRSNERQLTETLTSLRTTSVSTHYMDNILRSMSNLLLVLEPDGRLRTVNPAALRLLGYTETELIGQPFSLICPPQPDAPDMRLDAPTTHLGEALLVAKNGVKIPIAYTRSMLRAANGGLEGVVLVAQDITERRAAEAERLRNAMRYRALFEQTNDAILLLDLEGKHLAANQRAADLLGYSVAELTQLRYQDTVVLSEHSKSSQVLETLISGNTIPIY
ncbi:MAG: PAS domain S-box protein [Armatimonadetes bacterium]|nr:PAS domain S-box protein [Anaerolineae bacterium]